LAFTNGQTFGRSGSGTASIFWNPEFNLTMSPGDTFSFRVTATAVHGSGVGGTQYYSVNITGNSLSIDSAIPILSPAVIGDMIRFNEIQPKNIFQKDFFTSLLKMFYLLVTEDKNKPRHLVIEPWVEFFQTSNYLDWSDKVDRSKPIRIKPMSEINARYYELKYKSDTDFFNDEYRKRYSEGYGDRVFDNGLDFAKESEKVEVIFSASVLTGYDGEDKVVPAVFKRSNNLEDRIEHNIRIMQKKKVTGVTSWDIMSGATVLGSYTEYPYAGHLDDPDAPNADINFGVPKELYFELVTGDLSNNLFNAYYSPYFSEITNKDSRLLRCDIKLNEIDMFNLDFSRFIFIDGGLYRLSKIIDYNTAEHEPTKTELLRVIYTTY
jgi:hypothetical protein